MPLTQQQTDRIAELERLYNFSGSQLKLKGYNKEAIGRELTSLYNTRKIMAAANPLRGLPHIPETYGPRYSAGADPMLQHLESSAIQSNSGDDLAALQNYVASQYAKQKALSDRAQAEGGMTQAYDQASQATFRQAQPILQAELARLGILQGGAISANNEQLLNQQAVARGQQLGDYRQGTAQGMQALTVDQMQALNDLRAQQRAQNLATQMQTQNQNAARHQADRMLPWQIGGQILNTAGDIYATKRYGKKY